MANITLAGGNFFADPGALIIPVSVVAGGEKHGMLGHIVKVVPDLARAFQSARRTGHLKAGGSFTIRLCFGNGSEPYGKWMVHRVTHSRTLILMGLAIGPGAKPLPNLPCNLSRARSRSGSWAKWLCLCRPWRPWRLPGKRSKAGLEPRSVSIIPIGPCNP